MNSILTKLYLLFHTMRHLSFWQIAYRIAYTLKRRYARHRAKQIHQKLHQITTPPPQRLQLIPNSIPRYLEDVDAILENKFTFINQTIEFGTIIDWHLPSLNVGTRLWKLNLNYHSYLVDIAKRYVESKDEKYLKYIHIHIESWWKQNPFGTLDYHKDNWNAYAISLRTMAWIKVYQLVGLELDSKFQEKFTQSLYAQLKFLSQNLEFDIRGNHLLENAFALLWGAYYFEDVSFYSKAKKLLISELDEQILKDGGHFERSPMYHQIIFYRLLDAYNLVYSNPKFEQELLDLLHTTACSMRTWLEQMTFKLGTIPMFNDCASNIAPTTEDLIDYADTLQITSISQPLNDSGYRNASKANYEIIVDAGKAGPDYLLAHAHNDMLSFILYVDGQALIVDTGTSIYNAGERRTLERSTAAHNTVQVGAFEQTEIWSSFRVARRTRPIIEQDEAKYLQARIEYATTKAMHRRRFEFSERNIVIQDECKSKATTKAHLHFHPDISVELKGKTITTPLANIQIENAIDIQLEKYHFAQGYNQLTKATKAIITFDTTLSTSIQI